MESRLTILMYHHIVLSGEQINGMTVTEERLREDLTWLRDHGYITILPRDLAAGTPLPKKAVLITFDDGYASNYHYAFPLLRELNMKATVALIGSMIDSGDPQFLNWDMCREMERSGLVELGSHSYNLHNLDERAGEFVEGGPNGIQRLPQEDQASFEKRVFSDLEQSIARMEQEIGTSMTCFSYPFGVKEPWAESFIQEHFPVTMTVQEGTADLSRGCRDLPRKTVTMERSAADCFSFWDFLREFKHSIWDANVWAGGNERVD